MFVPYPLTGDEIGLLSVRTDDNGLLKLWAKSEWVCKETRNYVPCTLNQNERGFADIRRPHLRPANKCTKG